MRYLLFFVVFLLVAPRAEAQNRFGLMPQFNGSFTIGNFLKVNSKLENRFIFYQNPANSLGGRTEYERTDIELVATAARGSLKNFGVGYLVRRSDIGGTFLHRSIQQYSVGQTIGGLQFAHRFRTDQTFEQDEDVQYRLRYRISFEKPLSGLQVDPREYYVKFNNEYLGVRQGGETNLEIRLLAALGYNHSEDDQIELGLDYRAESIIGDSTENLLWLTVGWYHSF
ncbi:DUF2490 domain-containing protein [Sphingobacterium suaedae]|uniref:DUF2490 domain-containing protein n=1 Tax=Sphingobacterium suaedae TaxID=1686402 RepID=A0ABW5KIC3_9SPHI